MACRSPSTIIGQHLPPATYTLDDFLANARAGFAAASERVREVYGYPCTRAAAQLQAIEVEAGRFLERPDVLVTVEAA